MHFHFGPVVEEDATTFRLYAPSAIRAEIVVKGREPAPMSKAADGFWTARMQGVREGARYQFQVGDLRFPDLASRQQDGDTSGLEHRAGPCAPFIGHEPLRPWHETVICEVHVGTVYARKARSAAWANGSSTSAMPATRASRSCRSTSFPARATGATTAR